MLTSAKGLGGGFPVGAMMVKEEYAALGPGNHGSTFGGNPLAMAAVKAVLGVINDPAFLEEVRFKGTVLKNALIKLAEAVPGAEVRGEGLLLGLDLGDTDLAREVFEYCLDRRSSRQSGGRNDDPHGAAAHRQQNGGASGARYLSRRRLRIDRGERTRGGGSMSVVIPDLQNPPPPPSPLSGRDCLTLAEFSPEEISLILDEAIRIKALEKGRIPYRPLRGRTLAMVFQKPSNRTRVSFEVGMYQLGGHALHLSPEEIQIGKRETPSDTGRVLARYIDAIMVRTFDHGDLEELAGAADVPVVNGLSDAHHPCQALADLMTVREELGALEGTEIAYVGDGNNVAHSLAIACALTGTRLTIAHPEGHGPDAEIVDLADSLGAAPRLTGDPAEAVRGAGVVYTDVWASMGQEAEAKERKQEFAPYQVDEGLMDLAAEDAIFLHCLPAHRGEEVTAEVIDGPRSRVFDQAENRLHAQKALLYLLMG